MTEKALKRRCIEKLKGVPNLLFEKRHASQYDRVGKADLMILWNGVHYEIELKVGDNKPTAAQKAWCADGVAAGAVVAVVRTIEEFIAVLNRGQKRDMVFQIGELSLVEAKKGRPR